MILGVIDQPSSLLAESGVSAYRYWRVYFTGHTGDQQNLTPGLMTWYDEVSGTPLAASATVTTSSQALFDGDASLDGDPDFIWKTAGNQWCPSWIQQDFGVSGEIAINQIDFVMPTEQEAEVEMFGSALIQGSADGSAWSTEWVVPPQDAWGLAETRQFTSTDPFPQVFVSDVGAQLQTAASVITFSDMNFALERTDRLVAVAIATHFGTSNLDPILPISSVTIGGETATLAVRSKDASSFGEMVEIWYARPTGISGDVVITLAGTENRYHLATVWNIGGVGTATPEATDRRDAAASGDLSIAAPSSSVVIAAASGTFADNFLSGLGELFVNQLTSASRFRLGQEFVTSAATKTITASTTGARVAACWSI